MHQSKKTSVAKVKVAVDLSSIFPAKNDEKIKNYFAHAEHDTVNIKITNIWNENAKKQKKNFFLLK